MRLDHGRADVLFDALARRRVDARILHLGRDRRDAAQSIYRFPRGLTVMGFIALIFALLIEQGRPLPPRNWAHVALVRFADGVRRATDAGHRRYGRVRLVPGHRRDAGAGAVRAVAGLLGAPDRGAGGLRGAALPHGGLPPVPVTRSPRSSSRWPPAIRTARARCFRTGCAPPRSRLPHRRRPDQRGLPAGDLARAGRRASATCSGRCSGSSCCPAASGRCSTGSRRCWPSAGASRASPTACSRSASTTCSTWLPLRLSAAGFAIVGNFEDAVYCWRGAVAAGTGDDQRALLLATGGGALGVRIAEPELEARWGAGEQGFDWQGAEPAAEGLRSAVGLVWRSVVLWIALFAMLTVANWLGR